MKSLQCVAAILPLLMACAAPPSHGQAPLPGQAPLLQGLKEVRVVVTWAGGTDADKSALQAGVELKLRQIGMHVLTPAELSPLPDTGSYLPMLFVAINGPGTALPVTVQLYETVTVDRDRYAMFKHTASDAYNQWDWTRIKDPKPITDAERNEHWAPVVAEMKENMALPLPLSRKATTWQMYGVVQSVQPESVKDIVARYAKNPYQQTPAGREMLKPMMDAEVQAALATTQCKVEYSTVRITIDSYVDAFINDWLAANPKQR